MKSRITMTVNDEDRKVLEAFRRAGLDPRAVLVEQLRKIERRRAAAPRRKKISPEVGVLSGVH